jgi:parallel beta-helix repeat protein
LLKNKTFLIALSAIIIGGIISSTILFTVYFPSIREYKSHKTITILNDQDFKNYRFPGSGLKNDPYLIKGLEIISEEVAIWIQSTTRYFEIRNCKLESPERAVYVDNVAQETASIRNNEVRKGLISIILSNEATIENNLIQDGNFSSIRIENSVSVLIRNNTIINDEIGIFLVDASYSIIEDNNIYTEQIVNESFGVYDYGNVGILSQGPYNTIRNNTILKQDLGIYHQGASSVITYNTISNCSEGIFCRSTVASSINNNNIVNNTEIGISIFRTGYTEVGFNYFEGNNISLQLSESYFNDVRNNTFLSNSIGVEIRVEFPGTISYIPTNNNTVRFNLFVINSFYGVFINWLSNNSMIFQNSFYFNNNEGSSQAYDNGKNSEWSNYSSQGNFWSEWLGIGDYSIDGPSNSTDSFPLTYPPV